MLQRRHNLFWLLPALLLLAQSLLPAAALADVTMRCAGTVAAAPCARMTVSLMGPRSLASHLAQMPCCHAQMSCPMASPPSQFRLSASRCIVTVRALDTASAALTPSPHRWMLLSAPALAPPAVFAPAVTAPVLAVLTAPCSSALAPRPCIASHGLRGPPCA